MHARIFASSHEAYSAGIKKLTTQFIAQSVHLLRSLGAERSGSSADRLQSRQPASFQKSTSREKEKEKEKEKERERERERGEG